MKISFKWYFRFSVNLGYHFPRVCCIGRRRDPVRKQPGDRETALRTNLVRSTVQIASACRSVEQSWIYPAERALHTSTINVLHINTRVPVTCLVLQPRWECSPPRESMQQLKMILSPKDWYASIGHVIMMVAGVLTLDRRQSISNHVGGVGGFSKVVATFNHVGGYLSLLMATIGDVWIIPSFELGIKCCMLCTFHVSSRIVANISESSLLLSQ